MSNMRQLALAVANQESATKYFPAASLGTTDLLKTQTAGGHGDVSSASDDGFSWLYQSLPFIEELILHKQMQTKLAEDDAQTGPFDVDFTTDTGEHFAATQIGSFRCPSYSGPLTTQMGDVDAAVGSYCAIVGTDLTDVPAAAWKKTPNWENGGMPSTCWNVASSQINALNAGSCGNRGIGLRDMSDGISKTIIMAETREEIFSAWLSGASMWVMAASPNSLAADGASVGIATGSSHVAVLKNGADVVANGWGLALNFGEDWAAPPADHYLQASDWATNRDRMWGPSSQHAGNIVIHAYADAHAQAIFREINSTAYLRFVTRGDGDTSNPVEIE
jgi:hypothetical protein